MRRTALLAVLGLLGSGLVVSGATGTALAAPVDEVVVRPASGTFSVQGHGWGHGRGMSQWGAQGAATLGRSADEITSTYYPGTGRAVLADDDIRVWISADEGRDTTVWADPALRATDRATGRDLVLPQGPTRFRVVATGTALRLDGLTGTTWSPVVDGLAGPVRLSGPELVRVALPGGTSRDYRGAVQATRTGSSLKTVVVLSLEDYLLGVVPRESSSGWKPAALQAQSIAARSYSAYKRDRVREGADYDICETTACQVFGGSALVSSSGKVTPLEPATTTAAVQATRGVVRTHQGRAILAEFSSSNGGWSTAGHVPYLTAREDPWDGVTGSPVHAWDATLTVAQLEKRFPAIGTFRRLRVTERDGNGEWGGRVRKVVLEGDKGTAATTGAGIYNAAPWPATGSGLRSSWWRITGASPGPSPAPRSPGTAPSAGATPLTSSTVQQSLTPALVRHPGTATGEVSVAVQNTGRSSWPVEGLHLQPSSGTAGNDGVAAGPGALTGNRTTPGASAIAPGETATFTLRLDARRLPAGDHPRSYRLQIGDGPLFGTAVRWPFRVTTPRLSAALVGPLAGTLADGRTVVVPRRGSAEIALGLRNTGSLAWPADTVALGTSGPRNRASVFTGPGWAASNRTLRLGDAVPVGQSASATVRLHGNGRGVGVATERFEPLWSGGGWLTGAVVAVNVVRVDPQVSRLATVHSAPAALTVARTGTTTAVVRLRNLGGSAWTVGREAVSTSTAHPLRTRAWGSPTRPPTLAGNAVRPGATTVEPGEIGEWRVPFSGAGKKPGRYATTLVAVGPGGTYGPTLRMTLTVR